MNKTRIEWCNSTWNPVTGCLHGCEYCYARRIANRFTGFLPEENPDTWGFRRGGTIVELDNMQARQQKNGKIVPSFYPFGFTPTLHRYRLKEPEQKTKPQTIFVCSMADLFGEWVPDEWIEEVFKACERAPQHRYLFLTKNPFRYERLTEANKLPMKDNMWYGTTVTGKNKSVWRGNAHWNAFLSMEPLLESVDVHRGDFFGFKWIIIGAETGNCKGKVVPQKEWIDTICEAVDYSNVSVFMKDSLIPIVGEENMRREFPWSGEER